MGIRACFSAALAAGTLLNGSLAHAADDDAPLSEVVVTATRVASDPFKIPASISTVSGDQLRNDALGVNVADDVATVPGLLARNRYNYAQDQQISIRGIGANSAFGIRGVRVYQDGIPATGADGQGQVSQFNLDSASRVEILRGPFSALYGNSSGGVIQIFTADGHGPAQVRTGVAYGSFDNLRAGMDVSGGAGPLGFNIDVLHFQVDGYRDHSSAKSDSFNGKANYEINDTNRIALVANVIARPDAQDPLGLCAWWQVKQAAASAWNHVENWWDEAENAARDHFPEAASKLRDLAEAAAALTREEWTGFLATGDAALDWIAKYPREFMQGSLGTAYRGKVFDELNDVQQGKRDRSPTLDKLGNIGVNN